MVILSKLPITSLNHTNYPDCWKSTFSSQNLPQISEEGRIKNLAKGDVDIYIFLRETENPMKAEVGGGQDRTFWEQFGKLMFDWEEGTAV